MNLPFAAGDPLALTAFLVPAAVLAAAGLDHLGRRHGARALPSRWRRGALLAVAAWLIAACSRDALGLADLAPALAAALGLLALGHAAVQLVAWRPLLGRGGRPPAWLFAALPLAFYLLLLPWTSERRPPDGDEPYYLLITHSLAFDFDADLSNNYREGHARAFLARPLEPQPGDPRGAQGELFSRHNTLFPLVLAVPYRLAGKAGALVTMAALAALLAWRVLALALRVFPRSPGDALLAYGLLAFASPLLIYSGQVWVEVPAALLTAIALEGVLAGRGRQVVLVLVLLPFLKFRFLLLAGPLALFALLHARRGAWSRRSLLASGGALLAAVVALLVFNQMTYGNPLKMYAGKELLLPLLAWRETATGLVGLFFDVAFGLFGAAPVWLLLLPAVVWLVWRRHPWRIPLLLVAAPTLLYAAPRGEWYGGWSPPFRYGIALLPLLTVALVPLLADRRRPGVRVVLAGLLAATLGLTALWLAEPGWAYNHALGRSHWLDATTHLGGGDVARFFPSYVRPRLASWLWPPLAAAGLGAAWAWRRPRWRSPGAATNAGVAGLLILLALTPLLGTRWPTHRVELEDPWTHPSGGHLDPPPWTPARIHYRSGWVLRPGETLAVPVVPGGREAKLALELQFVHNPPVAGSADQPLVLEVRVGEAIWLQWTAASPGVWQRLEVPAGAWPPGAVLTLSVAGLTQAGPQSGILFDRLEIDWS